MKSKKDFSIKKPIIYIKILDNKQLCIIDAETTIRLYNKDSLKLENGFKTNITHERYSNNVVSYSGDGTYFAVITADCKESRLYNVQTKKVLARINRHQGEVSCIGIDPLSRYMFSAGEDGKTFALNMESGQLVFTLPHHADTINDIAFSKNGNWLATASYDKKILLYNLITMSSKEKLRGHSSAVMKVKFFGKNKLISIDKNSRVIIWNIYNNKVVERLKGIHDDVIHLTLSGEDRFLFLGTKLGYILVYDLNTYELISDRFIKIVSPITSLSFDEEHNHLIVGTEDGFLMYYYIYDGEERLKELLMTKNMDAIEKTVKENPILRYTNIYDLASNFWENTLKKAKIALQNHQKEKALLMLHSFEDIPSKKSIIKKLINDYAEYDKFVTLAKSGKLALAYSLANRYPVYKESKIFSLLEEQWKKTLKEASKYVLKPKGVERANQILAPYRGISEKMMIIKELITKGEIYKRFKEVLARKDFRIAFELIRQYPFLKEFSEYESLLKYADNLHIKIQKLINSGDNVAAMKLMRVLGAFPDFQEEIKVLMKDIENQQKFYSAVESGDYATAYNMMTLAEDLQETEAGKKLKEEWNEALSKANGFAAHGDAEGVKEVLEKYFTVRSQYSALGTIFAWCYINQLQNALLEKRDYTEIEKGIKNYVMNFGVDDQIEMFFALFQKRYKESKLNIEALHKGSLNMWRPSMIVASILDD